MRQLLIIALLLVICANSCDSKTPSNKKIDQAQGIGSNIAPDFRLKDMSGQEFKLSDLVGSKPLVLDFWASWCPYCRAEIPKIVELHNNYKNKINIVGISLDQSYADAQNYTQKNFIPYPNLYDAHGLVAQTYHISGIPSLIIINSEGEIIKRNASLEDVKRLIK